jgi:hypothetical protein
MRSVDGSDAPGDILSSGVFVWHMCYEKYKGGSQGGSNLWIFQAIYRTGSPAQKKFLM